jgi:small subunit ribosomal protein S2
MMPTFTMRELLESGVHFGHHTRRWNPKMKPYLFGVRNNTHIVDLQQTVPMLHQALQALRDVAAGGGRVLFVCTKRQGRELAAQHAERCGQYFVNDRWLGGMLTNWATISKSIKRLKDLNVELENEGASDRNKRELLGLTRNRDKLERTLGGIKDMAGLPNMIFVVDTVKEHLAIAEAKTLGIPVVAIVDSNSDPSDIAYPIPGNDDAIRAVNMYCQLAADAVLDGLQKGMVDAGVDIGAAVEFSADEIPAADPALEAAIAAEAPAVEAAVVAEETPAIAVVAVTNEAPAVEAALETVPAETPAS